MYDAGDRPLDRYTSQRRLIGLLATLALAGEGGLTRDKLVGLLWPDYAPDRARHSLTQALYAARKASGEPELFFVSETVRLRFDRITCDVVEFEECIRADDFAGAVNLYRGPLLDGFFLPSSEFENWLQHERQRLEDLAVLAYTRVIDALETQQDYATAVERARRLAAIRPTDANIAQRLMRLLAAAGDRAAAISHAHTYATMVREQHELEPDPAVLQTAHEIRQAPRAEPAMAATESRVEPEAAAAPEQERAPALRTAPLWKWLMAVLPMLALAIMLIIALQHRRADRLGAQSRRLVVAPFRVTSADARLQYLSEGMIELLSNRLADDTTDRSVDPAAVLRAWRDARINGSRAVPADSILEVARQIGAERVITGSVIGTPEHLVINAALVAVPSGNVVSHTLVEGSADTLTKLVDALARRMLLKQIGADDELADRTSTSLPALRAYLRGSASLAAGDYMIALHAYQQALELDNGFALAAFKAGLVAGRVGEFEVQRQTLDRAWRGRANLNDRDQALLTALLGPQYPRLSTVRQAVSAWNRAARLGPERAEAWFGLAAATFNSRLHDVGGEVETITAALQRALALDSTFSPARILLSQVERKPFLLAPPPLDRAGPSRLREFALAAQRTRQQLPRSLQALQLLESHAPDANEAMSLLIAEHSGNVLSGDANAAVETTRRMQRVSPATRAHLRLRVLDALYASGDTAVAGDAARQLESEITDVPDAAANACVLAQWHLARGAVARSQQMAAEMKRQPYTPVLAGVHPAACGELLAAGTAVTLRTPNARARLQLADSLDFTSVAAGDAASYAELALARWHLLLNDSSAARVALATWRLPQPVWPKYAGLASALEAKLTNVH